MKLVGGEEERAAAMELPERERSIDPRWPPPMVGEDDNMIESRKLED
jgi:hypothetical protein